MNTQHIDLNLQLTTHFALSEFIRSGVALRLRIANTPTPEVVNNLRLLCEHVLEQLNNAVYGKPNSQHLLGQAADIHLSNKEVAMKMFHFVAENLDYDQLIFERRAGDGARWLHVSYRAEGNRHMALKVQVKEQTATGALG